MAEFALEAGAVNLLKATVAVVLLAGSEAVNAQTGKDPSAQCSKDLATKPEFSLLVDKLPVGDARNITFAMLASDAIPTTEERNAIAALFAANEQCGKLGESYRLTNYPPEINSQLLATMTAINLVGVDLYKGKITYGEANKRLAAIRDDTISKFTIIVQQYKKELDDHQAKAAALQAQAQDRALQASIQDRQAAAEEQAQRQRRSQMILNYLHATMRPYQPPPSLPILQGPRSTTSNCYMSGNQVSCTTN